MHPYPFLLVGVEVEPPTKFQIFKSGGGGGGGGVLTKNLVTFKRQDGVKDEKLSILWVH